MKNIINQFIQNYIIRPFLSFIIGVRYENTAALKQEQQYIIVANHNSHLDALSIRAALPESQRKKTYTVAALDYFGKNNFCKSAMRFFLNAILIKRKKTVGEPSAIATLDNLLKKGKSLILFPEGSRGQPGVLAEFKKGIAILLKKNPQLAIVPAYLNGFGRVMPKDSSLCLPMLCKVRFGDPLRLETADIDTMLQQVQTAILSLKPSTEKDLNKF